MWQRSGWRCGAGSSQFASRRLFDAPGRRGGGRNCFLGILGDGSVATWHFVSGSSSVQDQLKNVQQIQASDFAFAPVLGDGSVIT